MDGVSKRVERERRMRREREEVAATHDPPQMVFLFPPHGMLQFVAVLALTRSTPDEHTHCWLYSTPI